MKITILNYFHHKGFNFIRGREDKFFSHPNFRHFTAYSFREWDHKRKEHVWHDLDSGIVMWLDKYLIQYIKKEKRRTDKIKAKEIHNNYWDEEYGRKRNDKTMYDL